ncbi:unnamed protein product, partial [marine sediment metagenome]
KKSCRNIKKIKNSRYLSETFSNLKFKDNSLLNFYRKDLSI